MTDATPNAARYDREACLRTFAAEMQLAASTLERDIVNEEERSGRHDPSDVTYPMTAKTMRDRHRNIVNTLSLLHAVMMPIG